MRVGRFTVIAAVAAFVIGTSVSPASAMTGGVDVEDGKYPFVVELQTKDPVTHEWSFFCGASLVHPSAVLTARHCLRGLADDELRLVFDRTDRDTPAEHSRSGADFHEIVVLEMDGPDPYHDMALIVLETAVNGIDPVSIPQPGSIPPNTPGNTATLAGWGVDESGDYSTRLKEHPMLIRPLEECTSGGEGAHLEKICAGDANVVGSGDSGGPLFIADRQTGQPTQIGAVYGGLAAKPTTFTDTSDSSNWEGLRNTATSSRSKQLIEHIAGLK